MDLYLIRHTRPQVDARLCYGQLDVALAPDHVKQCAAIASRLPALNEVHTSPLSRCRTLAEAIAASHGIAPVPDERLSELKFGEWEGRSWEAIDRGCCERWAGDYWNVAPPGGETYRTLYERVGAALTEIFARNPRRIALVTHAGPIRATLARCLGLVPERYPDALLEYGGIALLRGNGERWRLAYLNG